MPPSRRRLRRLAAPRKPALSPRWGCVTQPISFGLRKPSNSAGEASATAGTTGDGEAPVGTGVASTGGAARVGVVRPGGTAGDGRARAQSRVRRAQVDRGSQIGREANVRDHSQSHFPAGVDDLFARGRSALRRSLRDAALRRRIVRAMVGASGSRVEQRRNDS